jgi:hypothetical protein
VGVVSDTDEEVYCYLVRRASGMIKTMKIVYISKIIEKGTFVCQYGVLQAKYEVDFDEDDTIHDVFRHHGVVALLLFIQLKFGKPSIWLR